MHAIAIDGPAGAGKSTIAKRIAGLLNFLYIDTGAMYRAMALYMLDQGIESDDKEKIEAACSDADIELAFDNGERKVFLNGADVSAKLRDENVGSMASRISVYPGVRSQLTQLQRKIASKHNVVMDGRDIGTVVLPDSDLKIYLTATNDVRALRRYKELVAKGESPDLEHIKSELRIRDERDSTRKEAPLKKADDAVEVDTSDMTIEEVTDEIFSLYKKGKFL